MSCRRRVVWFDSLPAQPMKGVILANEVLDALPCRRVVVRGGGVRELGIASDMEAPFIESERAPDAEFAQLWKSLRARPAVRAARGLSNRGVPAR